MITTNVLNPLRNINGLNANSISKSQIQAMIDGSVSQAIASDNSPLQFTLVGCGEDLSGDGLTTIKIPNVAKSYKVLAENKAENFLESGDLFVIKDSIQIKYNPEEVESIEDGIRQIVDDKSALSFQGISVVDGGDKLEVIITNYSSVDLEMFLF
jgi:hypothetical protein